MSLVILETYDNNPIEPGKMVVLVESKGPPNVWLAKEFSQGVDNLADVVGVVYPKTNNGRTTGNPDGFYYNDFDYFSYNDDLSLNYASTNPNYNGSFNPATDAKYIYLAGRQLVSVSKTYTSVVSSWKKVRVGTTHDLYLI